LDNAIMGAKRGATLTQRMLSFARRQQLDVHPLDLTALVNGMTDLLQSTLGTDVEIQTRFPSAPQKVVADANQVELALLNLCVNARDAMKKGGALPSPPVRKSWAPIIPGGFRRDVIFAFRSQIPARA